MGKKNKVAEIYNIDSVNMEIDYDKLAEAIVKANRKADEPVQRPKEKVGFWKSVCRIIINRANTEGRFTLEIFASMILVIFRAVAIIGFITSVIFICATYKVLSAAAWNGLLIFLNNILIILICAAFVFVILVFSLIIWGSANEIQKETDRSYIMAVFSGIVSLAALVVALVALFKS